MKISAVAGAAVAAGLVVGSLMFAPVAAAADTGPDSAACIAAQGGVIVSANNAGNAKAALLAASASLTDTEKADIAAAVATYDAKKAALDTALAALKSAPTSANAAAAAAAGDALVAAANNLIAKSEKIAPQQAAMEQALATLNAALADVDKNCAPSTPTKTPTPSVTPTATPPLFADCAAVRAAGKAPLGRSEPGYRPELDSDNDGLACEDVEGVAPSAAPRIPSAIDTGYAA